MPRKPRIHIEGAVYHVTAEGKNGDIFLTDEDREKYLFFLNKYKKRFNFKIYAYVLMNDHFHLLMEVNDEPLSMIMQGLQLSYTKYYNKLYKRTGSLFKQRYSAKLCFRNESLLTVVKYIHLNPVRGGLSPTMEYRWSSHGSYLNCLLRKDDIVDTGLIMSHFSPPGKYALKQYKWYMVKQTPGITIDNLETDNPEQDVSGNLNKDVFYNNETESTEKKDTADYVPDIRKIIDYVTSVKGISFEEILHKKRVRKAVAARNIIIYLAVQKRAASKEELSRMLNISPSRISRGYYGVLENYPLKREAESIFCSPDEG